MARRNRQEKQGGLEKLLQLAQVMNLVQQPQQQNRETSLRTALALLGLDNSKQDRVARVEENAADRALRKGEGEASRAQQGSQFDRNLAATVGEGEASRAHSTALNDKKIAADATEGSATRALQTLLSGNQVKATERGQSLGFLEGASARGGMDANSLMQALSLIDPNLAKPMIDAAGAQAAKKEAEKASILQAAGAPAGGGLGILGKGSGADEFNNPVAMSKLKGSQSPLIQFLNSLQSY